MINDVFTKSINSLRSTENGIHSAQVAFAFRERHLVGFVGEFAVNGIQGTERFGIELEGHNATLVVHGTRRIVLNRLRHVVYIDIVAENFPRTSILRRNGRTSKANIGCVRKRLSDNARGPNGYIALGIYFFSQSILPAMSLVHHNNDIASVAKRLAIHELLHSSEDNAIRFSPDQQLFEMPAAFCLHSSLAEE